MAMRSAPDPSGGFVKVATTTTITTTTTTVEGVGDRAAEVAEALLEVTRLKVELKEQSVEQEELREMLRARVQEVHDEAQARLMALDEKDKVQAALEEEHQECERLVVRLGESESKARLLENDAHERTEMERVAKEEAHEAQRLVEERAAGVQRKAAFQLFGQLTKRLEATVFIAWRNHVRAERKEHNAASELTAMLEAHELALAELEIQALDTKEKMSKRILKQLMGSLVQRLFASWARYATEQAARRDQMAEIANERRAAEAEQEALLEELAVSPLVHFKLRFAHPQPCVNAC